MKRADTHHNDQPATTSEDELVHEATEPTRIDVQPTDIMTGSPEQIRAQNGQSVVLDADVEPSEEPGNIVAAPVVPTAYAVAEEDEAPVEIAQAEKNVELQKSRYALFAIVISAIIVLISSIVISVSWKQRQTAIKKQTEILSINQEIIRMISHDFRGPMNNIRVLMELLRSEEMTREEFDGVAHKIS